VTARLVLLRHGRTAHNAEGRLQGQLDEPLDGVGRSQVAAVAGAVRALAPGLVLSSDLRRATETAELLGLDYVTDARLREIDLGGWQGLTMAEAAGRFPVEHAAWRAHRDVARGGGETYAAVADRAVAAIEDGQRRLPDPESVLLVVTHGGTARAVVSRLIGLPPGQTWPIAGLGNCRWSRLEGSAAGWRLIEHGFDPLGRPAALSR
jgi:broad specificity phosphatase PhoE